MGFVENSHDCVRGLMVARVRTYRACGSQGRARGVDVDFVTNMYTGRAAAIGNRRLRWTDLKKQPDIEGKTFGKTDARRETPPGDRAFSFTLPTIMCYLFTLL